MMTSLRSRLTLILGSSFTLLWAVAATWMLCHLQTNLSKSLDDRLASAARLVVSIVQLQSTPSQALSLQTRGQESGDKLVLTSGMACQVASLRGEILMQSHNSPGVDIGSLGEGYHYQTTDGVEWRTYTLLVDGIRISTADRVDQRWELKLSILLVAAMPVLLALVGSLILLWVGIGKGLEPLVRIKDALIRRNADCLDPLDIPKLPSELQPLVNSQNELLVRIADALERERRLTGDAAHELRSPLTAIKTHIQIAQLTDGDVAKNALGKAEESANRLQGILEQLLLLARVEGCLSFDDGLKALPVELAEEVVHNASTDGAVSIHIGSGITHVPIDAPSALVSVALRNLISNALRHTKPGTQIQLSISREQDMACFIVTDRGDGVADADLAHITKRFWHNIQHGGSGLGLAIVEAIAVRCQGKLSLRNIEGGFEAVIKFPLGKN